MLRETPVRATYSKPAGRPRADRSMEILQYAMATVVIVAVVLLAALR